MTRDMACQRFFGLLKARESDVVTHVAALPVYWPTVVKLTSISG
jgi:hypothetical protein